MSLMRTMPGEGPCAPLLLMALLVRTSLVVGAPVMLAGAAVAAVRPFVAGAGMRGMIMPGVAPPLLLAAPPVVAPPPVVPPPMVDVLLPVDELPPVVPLPVELVLEVPLIIVPPVSVTEEGPIC